LAPPTKASIAATSAASIDEGATPNAIGEWIGYFNTSGVNIRSGPGTGYPSGGQGQLGQEFCFTGQQYYGSGIYWWLGEDTSTYISGYVDEDYINYYGYGCYYVI
jgi:uncharacterized protein YraI